MGIFGFEIISQTINNPRRCCDIESTSQQRRVPGGKYNNNIKQN